MTFLLLSAYLVAGFYTAVWVKIWRAVLRGLEPNPPVSSYLAPAGAWLWLIAGWLS